MSTIPFKRFPLKLVPTLVITGSVLLAGFLFMGRDNVISLYTLHRDVSHMEQNILAANASIDSLKHEIQQLKSDTAYIEQIARERLGMAKKNEKIYKFMSSK